MPEDAPVNIGVLLESRYRARRRVLEMQTKLHSWAGKDPHRRFGDLYNLVYDPHFLVMAWDRVEGNTGARSSGIDRKTVRDITRTRRGVHGFLEELRADLKARVFQPVPVRERLIPKSGRKFRRLGIPTVRDRVVQAALKLVLEPIFEADFQPVSYGFRPERRAQDAIEEIRHYARQGYEWIFEGDIQACFDEIDHVALMDRVRSRVKDKRVCALVKAFLKAGLLDEAGVNRDTFSGTPQGGILSPLLANIALSVLDEHFQDRWDAHRNHSARSEYRRKGGATYRLVRYADDFVVLVNGQQRHVEQLWDDIQAVLDLVGLRLSAEKTTTTRIDDGFDFLGFRIQRYQQRGSDRWHMYTFPSKKSQQTIRRKVKTATTGVTHQDADSLFRQLGSITRGWCQYFRHGSSSLAYNRLQSFMWWRVWRWLGKKHPRTSKRWIIRHYYNGWKPEYNGVRLWEPTTMTIKRYRYRAGLFRSITIVHRPAC
jgi:RNA-directed DNA polymerase